MLLTSGVLHTLEGLPLSTVCSLLMPTDRKKSACVFHMKSNQSRAHTHNHLLYQPPTPHACHHSLALITPGQGTRQLGSPCVQKSAEIIQLANPKPVYSASPFPSSRNHNKVY